jgi:tripartite-type tricarboxylate transporter receptor subunit TctC
MKRRPLLLAAAAALVLPLPVAAQSYPQRPVRVVNGFAAGGGTDLVLRALLPKVSELLGQQAIVDYRPGAGGNLAMEIVSKAAPDGYTLLMGTPGLATNPSLYKALTFDPRRDFSPITLVGVVQNTLIVHPSVPARTVAELVALAKRQPGKLNFASPGYGTSLHLAAELFKLSTGTEIVHVPYKGGSQAQTDVMAGQPEMMFNVLPVALAQIKAGTLRALAVTGQTRAPALPDVPTMIEAGVPGYVAVTWNGILAPANTPRPIIDKLHHAIVTALQSPEVRAGFATLGQEAQWNTPEAFKSFLDAETEKWSRVIATANIEPQ